VPKGHGRHLGAFGELNRPISDLKSDLSRLRDKCRLAAQRLQGPFAGKNPLDALRHQYGHAMQLDVIFQPIKGWFPVRDERGRTHAKSCDIHKHIDHRCSCRWRTQAFAWGRNPVWGRAPGGALDKARRLCSTLNVVVSHGYMCDLTHDLVRLSKMIWIMSRRDFYRLCRRICARIAQAVRVNSPLILKSPEPLVRFATLTKNPANPCRVSWLRTSRSDRKKSGNYVPRYVPPHRRKRFASQACEGLKSLLSSDWRVPA
jgi:hypothetical protein